MEEVVYKIRGHERKKLKHELGQLKHFIKSFWFYEDIDQVMGGGVGEAEGLRLIEEKKKEIELIETKLKETI